LKLSFPYFLVASSHSYITYFEAGTVGLISLSPRNVPSASTSFENFARD